MIGYVPERQMNGITESKKQLLTNDNILLINTRALIFDIISKIKKAEKTI